MPFVLGLAAVVLLSFSWWRIFAKAGYGGWFGLLALIPGVNLLMLTLLAFSDWPVLAELRQLRERLEGG